MRAGKWWKIFTLPISINKATIFLASVHNLVDDNTLVSFASTVEELLDNNKMIVNPDKI